LLKHGEMVREAQKILDDIGFKLAAAALLSELTIGQQQLVATARSSTRGTRFLIFDEPTGYLTRQEAAQLFALIRRLKERAVTIVYISHRLKEVFQLADRVSILRDGQLVSTQRVADTDENALIAAMINRSIDQVHYKEIVLFGAEILRTEKPFGQGFPGGFRTGPGRRGYWIIRSDRRRPQRVCAKCLRTFSKDWRTDFLGWQTGGNPERE
jgi:ribose transport system ATP-binding protein